MAAALLLGAAEERDGDSPGTLRGHLNRVLRRTGIGGFATCLCADIAPNGMVTMANAGHLPPYLRGQELALASGLPLGISKGSESGYEQTQWRLADDETLTFLSDGVVEARNAAGELFGFERAAAISSESPQHVAQIAQQFGQEDDTTVLALRRMVAGEQFATPLTTPSLTPS